MNIKHTHTRAFFSVLAAALCWPAVTAFANEAEIEEAAHRQADDMLRDAQIHATMEHYKHLQDEIFKAELDLRLMRAVAGEGVQARMADLKALEQERRVGVLRDTAGELEHRLHELVLQQFASGHERELAEAHEREARQDEAREAHLREMRERRAQEMREVREREAREREGHEREAREALERRHRAALEAREREAHEREARPAREREEQEAHQREMREREREEPEAHQREMREREREEREAHQREMRERENGHADGPARWQGHAKGKEDMVMILHTNDREGEFVVESEKGRASGRVEIEGNQCDFLIQEARGEAEKYVGQVAHGRWAERDGALGIVLAEPGSPERPEKVELEEGQPYIGFILRRQ